MNEKMKNIYKRVQIAYSFKIKQQNFAPKSASLILCK